MLEFVRISRATLSSSAILLTLFCSALIAQSNPRTYEVPQALPSSGISSEEFERLVGLNSQTASQIPLAAPAPKPVLPPPEVPRPKIATEVVRPNEDPSPFPNQRESMPPPEFRSDESPFSSEQWLPWWQSACSQPILANDPSKTCRVELEQLIWHSMLYSPRVQSILIGPKIQRTDIQSAQGELERRRFAQTNYHNTSDPVGNTLTTGGAPRLNEQFWENSIGIRDRNALGGKTELSQMFNARDNNSLFFKPNNQADTKLSLNYTQPLMRGSGKYYNTSSIRIAGIKTDEKIASANRELQKHAWDIVNTYWELVLNRHLLEQARHGQDRLKQIKQQLVNREGRDLVQAYVSRANAAIANQQGQIETAKANIWGLQASLRQLVNSPDLDQQTCLEIVPLTMPSNELPNIPIEEELVAALNNRGDLLAIQQTIQIAMVQKNLAVNELRPQLDFETSSYVRGLRGNNEFAQSYGNQFDSGRPSFSSGVTFQNSVLNRTAKSNLLSRQLEIAKLQNDYSNELKKAYADIFTAIANAKATYSTTLAAIESTLSTRDEVDGHKVHFDDFMGENPSPSNVLNDLLDAENRLIVAENSWATRQVQHMLALIRIKYESGTLMTITAE